MLASLVRFALQRAGLIVALALVLLAYGGYLLRTSSLDIFPEFAGKRVIVQTEAPGLTPEQVELLVTQPIERSLAGLLGLESIRSESLQGLSVVTVLFDDDSDQYRDRQMVSERLALLTGLLPPGAGPPVVTPLSSSSATVMTLGLTSSRVDLMELRAQADWTLVPRLMAVPGVADVNVFGGEIKQWQIQLDPEKLRRLDLSVDEVLRAAEKAAGMPGAGFVENGNQRISLRVAGLPDDVESLRQVAVRQRDGVTVKLGDIATLAAAPRPPIGAASVGAEPGVVLMVIGQYGANTLSVSRAVESALAELEPALAKQDIRLHPHLFRPADYIERSLSNLSGHLLIGGFLVVLVLYAFLFDVRTAFISALAIPLSLLGAVIVLLELGVNLNIMILGGLAIALGEVVDDAIIDTENIFRRLRENRASAKPKQALTVVLKASLEVRGSVVYASFIVALSFIPLLTLEGVAGRLFAPLGQAYILAILMSLLTALTVTPALCYLLLARRTSNPEEPPLIRLLSPLYARLLRRVTGAPGRVMLFSALSCVVGLAFAPGLGGEFLPQLREGHFIVHTSSLPGTSLTESLRVGGRLTEQFRAIPGVESTSQWAGRAERGADTYGSHYSEYEVRLSPKLDGAGQQAVLDGLRDILGEFPGIQFEANTFLTERVDETLSGYTAPVAVNLYGSDLAELDAKALQVAALMRGIEGAAGVQVRSPPGAPLLQVRPNLDALSALGIRPLELADVIQVGYEGRVVGKIYEQQRYHELSVILPPAQRRQPDGVAALPLRSAAGQWLDLGQVADIQQTGGRYNILHRGGRRLQTVTCAVVGRDLDGFLEELKERLKQDIDLGPGLYPELTGAAVEQGEARRKLTVHALLAGAGILALIYLAIGSLRHTWLTVINLPFSLLGGVLAALTTGASLSLGAMVGFVTLFGITVRNAIMLISHYRHLVQKEGLPWEMATAIRGARERLPSILMTALVTALAMLPIAVDSDNPGREIMGPMAAIIIGGLISSTLLNLLVLPAVLWRFGRFEARALPKQP
ncbi:efflux RND transporter permease subunit [Methylococcus sp. EFPC2]|uniref:efflux RND transporter permease subunit n=1 Tax=Methylococcus sp. EFPC2 TaxID=2812648 RepID=UPI0019672583|nr:efflux RND transporter permease subunit [Methylococcus sp. EFPC2]QSA96316.1 efflux RND transporter permease subunit [Methylococcus sp. EFPC2]